METKTLASQFAIHPNPPSRVALSPVASPHRFPNYFSMQYLLDRYASRSRQEGQTEGRRCSDKGHPPLIALQFAQFHSSSIIYFQRQNAITIHPRALWLCLTLAQLIIRPSGENDRPYSRTVVLVMAIRGWVDPEFT